MSADRDSKGRPVVVVTGMGVLSSLGEGKEDNWRALTAGVSGIRRVSRFPVSGLRTTIAGTVDFVPVEEPTAAAWLVRTALRAVSVGLLLFQAWHGWLSCWGSQPCWSGKCASSTAKPQPLQPSRTQHEQDRIQHQPVAQQIAAALSGRHGLHTVHIIAHGAPGRVGFAAGHLDVDVLMAHPASGWRND